jgi:hypothetical protein
MDVRIEYEVAQALMWDAALRRDFFLDPRAALARRFPTLTAPERFGPRQFGGIEEEAHRRMAELCRASRELFGRGFHLLGGEAFFEVVLRGFLREGDSPSEPFDLMHVGERVLEAAHAPAFDGAFEYTRPVLDYEWARFRARQVIEDGVDPSSSAGSLVAGAALVWAPFDLVGLLEEIERISRSQAPSWLYAARARPAPGELRRVIFPSGRKIIEADVDAELYAALAEGLLKPALPAAHWGAAAEMLRSAGLLKANRA